MASIPSSVTAVLLGTAAIVAMFTGASDTHAQTTPGVSTQEVLPRPEAPFGGQIGPTYRAADMITAVPQPSAVRQSRACVEWTLFP